MKTMKVIGVTGGIGAGKSTVSDYLIGEGYTIIDADKIGRELINLDNKDIKKLYERFDVIDENNNLDRNKLSEVIFKDSDKVHQLNNLTHKILVANIKKRINDFKKNKFEKNKNNNEDKRNRFVFVDAALLFESNFYKNCDLTILITSDEKLRIERAMKRYDKTEENVKNIIRNQLPDEIKKNKATVVLTNNSSVKELESKISKIIESIE